ncbi:MAG: YfhO family protein [Anaerolineae bacterium]|uniref:YfhO family protein n=2 Tax=Thermoflexus sp. TaxID=1969742 RepID=UPI0025FD47CA|nr:YfhO family protein [Thermoflexus sp.]MCS7349952.1 YfhO family protein [Thermoflexus sp.]MDW8179400.1 YfhO family protein [Anaerolineae bacterium]
MRPTLLIFDLFVMALFLLQARWDRRRSARSRARMSALVALAHLLFFWPVIGASLYLPQGGGDLWGQLYPVWAFIAAEVRYGRFPLWNPRLLGGDPIFSEGQFGLFNPFNGPLFALDPLPAEAVLWRAMIPALWAGLGMLHLLSRSRWLRVSPPAALAGSLAYMFSSPFIVHLGHPPIGDTMAWFPWALWGLEQALTPGPIERLLRGGVPVALLILSGHGQMISYALLGVGVWIVLLPGPGSIFQRWARGAAAVALGFSLSAPMWMPALERLPMTERAAVPPEQRRGYELAPEDFLDLLSPFIHGRNAAEWWSPRDRVETGFIGAVALGLAVLGSFRPPSGRAGGLLLAFGGLGLGLALGRASPFYQALALLPIFDLAWKTARAVFLFSFALAALAAWGMEQSRRSGWNPLGIFLIVAGFIVSIPATLAIVPAGVPRERAFFGLSLAGAGLLGGWASLQVPYRIGRWMILAILLGEHLIVSSTAELERRTPFEGFDHPRALAFLKEDSGWFRVDVDPAAWALWPPNALQIAGLDTPLGSGNPMNLRAFSTFYWMIPNRTAPAYRMLGVKYIVVPKGQPPGGEGIWPVFIEDPQIDLHLHTGALPRAWLVYRTEVVETQAEALPRILDPSFAPEQVAVIERGPLLQGEGKGHIELLRYESNQLKLKVETNASALLVFSEVFYPGWRARLNGQPTPIYRVNFTFRGVLLPPGSHLLVMDFQPASLILGLATAAIGIGGLFGAMAWGILWSQRHGQGVRRF